MAVLTGFYVIFSGYMATAMMILFRRCYAVWNLRSNRSSTCTCRQWRISGGNKGVGFCDRRRAGREHTPHFLDWIAGTFIVVILTPWNMEAATDGPFMPLRARKIYIKERLYPQCLPLLLPEAVGISGGFGRL